MYITEVYEVEVQSIILDSFTFLSGLSLKLWIPGICTLTIYNKLNIIIF